MASPGGSGPAQTPSLKRILEIQVPILAVIGETRMTLGEVLQLNVGSIIPLNRSRGEPLELRVNDQPVGRGNPVRVGDRYGLELVEIGKLQDTILKLGEQPKA